MSRSARAARLPWGVKVKSKLDTGALTSSLHARNVERFEKDGAKVLVDMKSLLYLTGTELDYKDELMQSGFVFQNPNVKKACGCGASFTV